MALVPLIDIGGWHSGDAATRRALARSVDRACRDVGFLQITGHGVAASTIDALHDAADRFFALPFEVKQRSAPGRPGLNRGYAALESEALSYSLGVADSVPDRFEAFNIGPDQVPQDDWHLRAPHDFFAPNIWPNEVPELRVAFTRYFAAATRVALTLTEIFAPALGLPDDWFRPYLDKSTLTLRVLHYERRATDGEPLPQQMRMGAHTDYGVVTVLCADAEPGLEILGPDGSWQAVTPAPGALLVNLGDLTAQWTNDVWRSTLHRVTMPPPKRAGAALRRSAALFLDANYDAHIECLPTCQAPDRPARYRPVTAGEHLVGKLLGPRVGAPSTATTTAASRLATEQGDVE